MFYRITVGEKEICVQAGQTLLSALRQAGLAVDAPCGGEGRCGKCKVFVDGKEVLACQTVVDRDMTVTLPQKAAQNILTAGIQGPLDTGTGMALAFDIGTTTVVGYLLNGGEELAYVGRGNPQTAFGADVVTRIRLATQGKLDATGIRDCLEQMTVQLCKKAAVLPENIKTVCVVGNPAMQQLFLGLPLENLAKVPFAPVLTEARTVPAGEILPIWKNAQLQIVPNIAGFVGADTVAGILATGMDTSEKLSLLVDIGTNGEMVLGSCHKMLACSTAAGPALEGALIRFGMRGQAGAIDRVRLENGKPVCSVIGNGEAVGICGSGLIDAVAVALELGLVNERGKVLTADGLVHLTEKIHLTQEDIRQVQLAKGAIAAGIHLLAHSVGVALEDIETVYLAGAFGTYMDPVSACRIGLLPRKLEGRTVAVGNAAGSGTKLMACGGLQRARQAVEKTAALELSSLPAFPRCFAKNMRF